MTQDLVDHKLILNTVVRHSDNDPGRVVFIGPPQALQILSYALAENRLLDWAIHDSDIALLPHSPLALADVFSQKGGYLELIPAPPLSDDNHQTLTSDDDFAPTASARHTRDGKRPTRQRFNLLTQLSEADLLRQCKKFLVEDALVKSKEDRQLYLAAGFISWARTNGTEKQRAPLLFYPALLVRIPSEQHYEIRLAGDTPEFNLTLVQHIEQLHDCKLSAFMKICRWPIYLRRLPSHFRGGRKTRS